MKTIPVHLTSPKNQKEDGSLELRIFSEKERKVIFLKMLFGIWALAFLSIALPLVHFFLVPFFFFLAPAVAIYFYKRVEWIERGSATCPECKKEIQIAAQKPNWPLRDLCTYCQTELTIEKK